MKYGTSLAKNEELLSNDQEKQVKQGGLSITTKPSSNFSTHSLTNKLRNNQSNKTHFQGSTLTLSGNINKRASVTI
jgi:hypothetical protein